jgi:hypothetical protein
MHQWAELIRKQIEIIPRAQWGAAEPNMAAGLQRARSYNTIAIHHTGERAVTSPLRLIDPTSLSRIQCEQMEKGYADIGYHFIVSRTGQIFEGRSIEYVGAHVRGPNPGNIGVAMWGISTSNASTGTIA